MSGSTGWSPLSAGERCREGMGNGEREGATAEEPAQKPLMTDAAK